jgi:O-antigen/teichoic acid export membrane protein
MDVQKSGFGIFISKILGSGVSFLGIVLFARTLGMSTIGVFFLFQTVLGLLVIPADFGLRGGVEKRISEGYDSGRVFSTAIFLKLFPIFAICIIIMIFDGLVNQYLGANLAPYLALGLVLQEIANLFAVLLRGQLRVIATAPMQPLRQTTWLAIGGGLVSVGFGIKALIFGYLSGLILMTAYGFAVSGLTLALPSTDIARSLIDYSKYNLVSSVGGRMYEWLDVAILGLILGQSAVGAYEIAWRITVIVLLLSRSIATVIFPEVSSLDAGDARDEIADLISSAIGPSTIITIPAFFGVLILSKQILYFVFGAEYTIAWIVLILLMAETSVHSVHIIFGRGLLGINKPNLAAKATVVSLIIGVTLNFALIPRFGLTGAAVATFVSFTFNSIAHYYLLGKFINIQFPKQEVLWNIFSSVGMLLLIYAFTWFFPIESLFRLFATIAIGAFAYFSILVTRKETRLQFLGFISRMSPF